MENATKAMLIAAGVLIGLMILSLGVALYSELNTYVEATREQIEFNEQNSFNNQFTKYANTDLTIQDIVTVANLAHQNNVIYNAAVGDPFYIIVSLEGNQIENDIQDPDSTNYASKLLAENLHGSIYRCDNIVYSNETGRISEIHFRKL